MNQFVKKHTYSKYITEKQIISIFVLMICHFKTQIAKPCAFLCLKFAESAKNCEQQYFFTSKSILIFMASTKSN